MPAYTVSFARSAWKEFSRLEVALASRILEKIEALVSDPRPAGCRKLEGSDDFWRIRVGEYRVIYSIDDSHHVVDISAIRHRSDAYR